MAHSRDELGQPETTWGNQAENSKESQLEESFGEEKVRTLPGGCRLQADCLRDRGHPKEDPKHIPASVKHPLPPAACLCFDSIKTAGYCPSFGTALSPVSNNT